MEQGINILLRNADIEGFIREGAPEDEYESEAADIKAALAGLQSKQFTREAVIAIVSLVWAKSFDLAGDEIERRLPDIRLLADRIVQGRDGA